MGYIEKLKLIHRLHRLIEINYRGTAEDYARRLGISRSCLFKYIEELRNAGAEIEYDRSLYRFVYCNEFSFEINIDVQPIIPEHYASVYGGATRVFYRQFKAHALQEVFGFRQARS